MTYDKDTIVFSTQPTNHKFRDITGHISGRLTVLGFWEIKSTTSHWWCECECGTIKSIAIGPLQRQSTQSCGCLKKEWASTHCRTHGESHSVEFSVFMGAKNRCNNPNEPAYRHYGGRGIEFRLVSVTDLIADIGRRPTDSHSLDRIDNEGHYEVGNIKWSTFSEQSRNKRNNQILTANNESHCTTEWGEILQVDRLMLTKRKLRGWCDECTINIPPRSYIRCTHRIS